MLLFFIFVENYMQFQKKTRKNKDNGLLLVEIFAKIFKIKGLAVRDKTVYRIISGTLFS